VSGKAFGRILAAASDLPDCLSPHDVRGVAAAIERARVVGVLDAWAVRENYVRYGTNYDGQGLCVLVRGLKGDKMFYAVTLDAARAAAAKAIESGEV
jgi:hypothetical protein